MAGERVLAAERPAVWTTLWNRFGPLVIERRDLAAGARRRLGVSAIAATSLGIVGLVVLLVSVLSSAGLTALDEPVQSLLFDWRSPTLTAVMIALAIVFGPIALPIIVLVVSVVWGLIGRHAWRPLLLAAGMAVGVGLGQIVGRAVDRQRPPTDLMLFGPDASFSFPSGHVLGAADFVLITAYLVLSRRSSGGGALPGVLLGAVLVVVCIVLAAVSRLYLGYHWATDVLASVTLSLMIVGCVIAVDVWWGGRSQPGTPRAGEAVDAVGDESDADRP
ncbi:phosphatase PAP2 family protein [Cryobacterium frigoriphilum]|uniref:Phosphatase PAP2 family protein n=1 Tax=Cryobacterium frigoriphilum TaxID=1259150 RepID=A0A4R9A591_9MICO|nr:phosphatase PAP2 family protein [Cryobacterium frigoriphilum]